MYLTTQRPKDLLGCIGWLVENSSDGLFELFFGEAVELKGFSDAEPLTLVGIGKLVTTEWNRDLNQDQAFAVFIVKFEVAW